MTALENLIVAQHVALNARTGFGIAALLGLGGYARAERAAVARATAWLRATNLLGRADDPAGALPYGAQRRLEIARAMCTQPALLCLDEPAAGLNPRESDELAALLRAIRDGSAAEGAAATSVLLIEHDMGIVMSISDHVVVLDHGRKIAEGPPLAVRNDRHVIAAYLGEEDDA
jgi:branched-chain amino acid transport system ATP-binding protein